MHAIGPLSNRNSPKFKRVQKRAAKQSTKVKAKDPILCYYSAGKQYDLEKLSQQHLSDSMSFRCTLFDTGKICSKSELLKGTKSKKVFLFSCHIQKIPINNVYQLILIR